MTRDEALATLLARGPGGIDDGVRHLEDGLRG
jgi:hypothetical protein